VRAEELHHLLPGNDLQPTLEPTAPIEEATPEADSQAATNDGTTPEGQLRQFLINVGKLPLMPATSAVTDACRYFCSLPVTVFVAAFHVFRKANCSISYGYTSKPPVGSVACLAQYSQCQ